MSNLYKTYAFVVFMCLFVNTVCRAQEIARIEAWTVDQSKPSARSIYLTRGESLWIQPTVTYQGPWQFPSNASVVMRYKSSDMTNLYYAVTGSVYTATSGILRVLWTPAQEATAKSYSFEFYTATGTVAQLPITGSIFLKDSLTTMSVVSNPPVIVYWPTVYTDVTARASADYATNWIATNIVSAVDVVARGYGTNALAQIATETNRATNAESGINSTATNALNQGTNALALALANATPSGVSNIIGGVLSTGTIDFARTAGGLAITNGYVNLTIVGDVMTIIKTTNTTSVIVTATNGAGYNGPAVGTVWTNPVWTAETFSWAWDNVDFDGIGNEADLTFLGDADIFGTHTVALNVSGLVPIRSWGGEYGKILQPSNSGTGTVSVAYKTHTTTNTYDLSRFVTGTPWRAEMVWTNGVLSGTNSAVHTANGTNWHILFY